MQANTYTGAVELAAHEVAILELLRMQPVRYFPPHHLAVAQRLAAQGLLSQDGDTWFPTRLGLARLGITVH